MGFFSKDIKSMQDLFVHTLRDVYYAEKQILNALPEMIGKTTDASLKQAFQSHLGETKNHVSRIEQVFQIVKASIVRPLTELSRRPRTSLARPRTSRFSMLRSRQLRRQSSTMRSPATAR
jgi:Domain of unknown function (DUF892)